MKYTPAHKRKMVKMFEGKPPYVTRKAFAISQGIAPETFYKWWKEYSKKPWTRLSHKPLFPCLK